ncbi:MAG: response regulator transcription factor [Candidatus Obscuribacterales bacterium]|jgi:two-component system, OmpR family, manganese sensing response regulator|nr:response regulator transcription factor [Candidatus Obscuribacterales bacterium]
MSKILVVEDDLNLAGMLQDWLAAEHYEVDTVNDGIQGKEKLLFYKYDLLILDWDLPGISGLDICKEFRQKDGLTPVLFLTGRDAILDKEIGLDAGADDYLAKPFNMRELSARIRALLRRSTKQTVSTLLTFENLVLDPKAFTATNNGADLKLTRREFALLEFLMRHPNEVFSMEALLARVWQSESDASPQAVRTCIKLVRQKLSAGGNKPAIVTVHGSGYKLDTH